MKELVIISGKGGTGKTSFTAALAALWPGNVIADCDVDAADLHLVLDPTLETEAPFYSGILPEIHSDACTHCGKCIEVCHFNAISPEIVLDTTRCEGCGVCAHFCPAQAITLEPRNCGMLYHSNTRFGPMIHARLGVAEENSGKLVTQIKKDARIRAEKEGAALVIADGSPGIGCPVISSLAGANQVLAISEPSVSGRHDLMRVLQLAQQFKIPAAIAVNKWDLHPEMTETMETEARALGADCLGRIPYDTAVTAAMVAQKTLPEIDPGPALGAIQAIAKRLKDQLDTH